MMVNAMSCPWLIGIDIMGSGTRSIPDLQFLYCRHRLCVGTDVTPLPINFVEG